MVCDSVNAAPQNLLDYFVFNEGSYWVYQLKGTDTLDTLSFAGMDSEFFEQKAGCNYGIRPCEMRYSMGFNHSNLDKFPPGNTKNNSSNEGYYITYSKSRDQWDVEHVSGTKGGGVVGFFLAYPFVINQQFTTYRFLTDTNRSVTVPAGTFDCIITEMIPKPDYEGFYEELFFSKNIGLIRYQLSKGKGTWELINYHHN
ncbi:MAG: hypothetical protein VXX46_04215 [Bacteroidota bacterium]|nr:hypothetical protein [Bacteroidota bacterium]